MTDQRLDIWGERHAHSDWSDGYSTLQVNRTQLERYDHDFHVACDHLLVDVSSCTSDGVGVRSAANGKWSRLEWDTIDAYRAEVRASSTEAHIALDGIELTWTGAEAERFCATNRHHVLVRDSLDNLPPATFFRGASLPDVLAELKERGMSPFLAHINDAVPPHELTGAEIAGVEVRSDIERREDLLALTGLKAWDRWLTAGHRVALSAGSDAHQMDLWAGSGARNVLRPTSADPASVRAALLQRRGYVTATWHADVYERLGYPCSIPGAGSFTPWWMLTGGASRPSRNAVQEALGELIEATHAQSDTRTRRENYPTMELDVEGAGCGEEAEATDGVRVGFEIDMSVPIEAIRFWSDGVVVHTVLGDGRATRMEGSEPLDLAQTHYVRVDAVGCDAQHHTEYLVSNPIYMMR